MSVLFTPVSIRNLEIANRFARSATGESAATDGRLPEAAIPFYERLARGGIGLIITGHAYVRQEGRGHERMTGIHRDDLVPSLRRLTEAVHACASAPGRDGGSHPTRIVMQINHRGLEPPDEIDRMPADQIEEVVDAFVQAARRVKAAGFDGVQVHAAHGYLLSQFLSPGINHRTDEWKGSRLPETVIRAVREAVGDDFPVLVKFNGDGLGDDRLSPDRGAEIALRLEGAGADAVEVSGADAVHTNIRRPEQEAYFASHARRIKEAVKVPVILVGGLRSMRRMEEIIGQGIADVVSLSRPFIREPDLVRRFWEERRKGEENPVAACLSCGQCWSSPETLNQCGVLFPRSAP